MFLIVVWARTSVAKPLPTSGVIIQVTRRNETWKAGYPCILARGP
jgi:hypothetical protein